MGIKPHVFEWFNLSSSPTGVPPFTTNPATAQYPITLTAGREYSIFSGNHGLRINQPPMIKPNQMIVIDQIGCTPAGDNFVQILLEGTKYFENPDGSDFEAYGISGKMSPYPVGSPSTCNGTDAVLPAMTLDPPIYILPGQTWGALFTSLDGIVGVEQGEFTAVAAMIRYVLYDGLDAMIAMKLIDMGVSVKPSNIDWYKRAILKLNQEQRDEIQEAQDGNIPTVRPQSL